jgi:virulence-associated protein VapD
VKIIAHTKYGVFEGVENEYDEKKYEDIGKFLEQLSDLTYFSFHTDKGEIYFTKEMIADTLFILEK